jgi:hypothetical protein
MTMTRTMTVCDDQPKKHETPRNGPRFRGAAWGRLHWTGFSWSKTNDQHVQVACSILSNVDENGYGGLGRTYDHFVSVVSHEYTFELSGV